ncbi:hypothetical protein [Haladaptatus sp. T7]|uniref:hypothetical protein n=1 Tax=Haladaptatus sp. T7 TaxID=2029368 RepID=UPI002230CDE1|nr:hypothetical protein [Haladaptatus sp. T7]
MELNIFISLVSGVLSVPYFSNAISTLKIFRPIRSEAYTEKQIADTGDSVVLRGDITVDSPPEGSAQLFPAYNPTVGAYLWRISHSDNLYVIDLKNRTISRAKVGYESGIEYGDFSITTKEGTAKIDPTWLIRTHNTIPLSEATISTIPRTISFSPSMWSSPYIHLTSTETEHTIEEVLDLIGSKDVGGSHQYYVQAKPIESETTLTVYGNVRTENGTSVLYGTDASPLAITDQEPEEFRRYLTRRLVKYGVLAPILVIIAIFNWFVI